jgi:hypothetical protein
LENLDYFSHEKSFCIDRNHIFQVEFLQKFANKKKTLEFAQAQNLHNMGSKVCLSTIGPRAAREEKEASSTFVVACNNNYVHNISPFPLFD